MKAFCCDRCGKFQKEVQCLKKRVLQEYDVDTNSMMTAELCEGCYAGFVEFLGYTPSPKPCVSGTKTA